MTEGMFGRPGISGAGEVFDGALDGTLLPETCGKCTRFFSPFSRETVGICPIKGLVLGTAERPEGCFEGVDRDGFILAHYCGRDK